MRTEKWNLLSEVGGRGLRREGNRNLSRAWKNWSQDVLRGNYLTHTMNTQLTGF